MAERMMNIGISNPDINETHSNSSREAEEQEEGGLQDIFSKGSSFQVEWENKPPNINKVLAEQNKKLKEENNRLREVIRQSENLKELERLESICKKISKLNIDQWQTIGELKNENYELKKENNELKKTIKDLKTDNEDGVRENEKVKDMAVNSPQECVSSNGQSVILPSVSQKWQPHLRYVKPCNCDASCVMCTVVYIILEITGKILCWTKFSREIQRELDEIFHQSAKELESIGKDKNENQDGNQEGNRNEEQNVVKCCSSLGDLITLELIVLNKLFYSSPRIKSVRELDDYIRKAIEVMHKKDVRWALINVWYHVQEGSEARSHVMAIGPFEDTSNPTVCAGIYDAQALKLWPQSDKHAKSIDQFKIYGIDEGVAEKFAKKCGVEHCKEEYLAATRSGQDTEVLQCLCNDDETLDLL